MINTGNKLLIDDDLIDNEVMTNENAKSQKKEFIYKPEQKSLMEEFYKIY